MADSKGSTSKEGLSDWCILEAECSDLENDFEQLFEQDTDSDVSDLLDNGELEQGNSLELFHQQECEQSEEQLQILKRKYLSPKAVAQLSPRLESISLSPQQKSKRRLFAEQDSGLELSLNNEAEDVSPEVEVPAIDSRPVDEGGSGAIDIDYLSLLRSSNIKATLMAKFKESFGVGFNELTRQFKSYKTCCNDWVLAVYAVHDDLFESSKQLLQQHCDYIWVRGIGAMTLYLLCFKAGKNRGTVHKLMTSMLNVQEQQILSEPPKLRNTAAALFWYKGGMGSGAFTHGTYPDWIAHQTILGHQNAEASTFDFSAMVQWAFDNNYLEEPDIAYQYAKLAPEDSNAVAWLAHNQQAKFVRECAAMVRFYKKGQMKEMSMSEWIHTKINEVEGEGHWSDIVKFLRYQDVNFITFLAAFKNFLHAVPKHNCILIYGPPNSGKSSFAMSLIKVLKGRVLSFVNSKSQFWLQPLGESKIALLDDVTDPCWVYIDTYLRNGLDGHFVSLDCKYKAPVQIKFPPLLLTSNINVHGETNYRYLHSRIKGFEFPHPFPMKPDNTPQFQLTDQSWKSFFERLWTQLDLSDQEEEGQHGESQRAFQCSARSANEHI
ncbi:early protein [human papillomavirus 12]|uniref:Replication protein E1 n=1 Tax=Human papillomavirus 12 TaxID=10604 RepID=VE1_HPV12|nr:RecName: Full=Replication protein E1; AltName: Full=ATP-dependent helicase E1 [human papillomavirus 12]CAA52498.1 early protein [human papillomavirus 12]